MGGGGGGGHSALVSLGEAPVGAHGGRTPFIWEMSDACCEMASPSILVICRPEMKFGQGLESKDQPEQQSTRAARKTRCKRLTKGLKATAFCLSRGFCTWLLVYW